MKRKLPFIIFGVTLLVILSLSYLAFLSYFTNKFYPGVTIAGVDVSGKTPEQVTQSLKTEFQSRSSQQLALKYNDQIYNVDLSLISPQSNLTQVVDQAYHFGRSANPIQNVFTQLTTLTTGKEFDLQTNYSNPSFLNSQLNKIDQSVRKDPIDAQIALDENLTITPAQVGSGLDSKLLTNQINDYLNLMGSKPTSIQTTPLYPEITTQAIQTAQAALLKVKANPIILKFDKDNSWTLDEPVLFSLLDLKGKKAPVVSLNLADSQFQIQNIQIGRSTVTTSTPSLDNQKTSQYLDAIAQRIDQPAEDAKFDFDGTKVTTFKPSQEGRKLNQDKTRELIEQALQSNQTTIELPVEVDQPKIASADTNNFGIEGLIGTGVSHFQGSIPNRIYNIGLAASRIHGTLIAPGEVFSWNKIVGDISAATGYKQAYVIKSGHTVLDDGGGVCQVSTTLFRAVLNSGLPVLERTAHAYRVGYYEQGFPPGIDATIYYPSVDFKFKNDTDHYILIQSVVDGTDLTINIYGKSDGREVSISTPVVTNVTPAPPDLRQDDPTLPKGTVKQVDFAAAGANISFKRTVTRNGETLINETWHSNYRPWQAVYLVGTM